jgi:hypothetical protein
MASASSEPTSGAIYACYRSWKLGHIEFIFKLLGGLESPCFAGNLGHAACPALRLVDADAGHPLPSVLAMQGLMPAPLHCMSVIHPMEVNGGLGLERSPTATGHCVLQCAGGAQERAPCVVRDVWECAPRTTLTWLP